MPPHVSPSIDTTRRVATPEGIELVLRLAGPVPRAYARVIDFFIQAALLTGVAAIAGAIGGVGAAAVSITAFLTLWLLPAWCEARWDGATPGKRIMNLKVVMDDGRPIGWGPALVRNLLWTIDFLPVFFAAGLLAMIVSRDFKRLGDLAAGTIVIHLGEYAPPTTIANSDPHPPARPLTLTEQRTVIDFAERIESFSEDRAIELAEILAPILDGQRGSSATTRMRQIASHLLGASRAIR